MPLPFRYEALTERFTNIRSWAKQAVAQGANRCTICMTYTLQIAPSEGDATITSLADPACKQKGSDSKRQMGSRDANGVMRSKWGQIKIQEDPLPGACNAITKFCSDPFCVVSGA